jgi:hypothetical protein
MDLWQGWILLSWEGLLQASLGFQEPQAVSGLLMAMAVFPQGVSAAKFILYRRTPAVLDLGPLS